MSAPISDDAAHSEQPEPFARAAANASCQAILRHFGTNGG